MRWLTRRFGANTVLEDALNEVGLSHRVQAWPLTPESVSEEKRA